MILSHASHKTIKKIMKTMNFMTTGMLGIRRVTPNHRQTIFHSVKNMNSILYTLLRAPNTAYKKANLTMMIRKISIVCTPLAQYMLTKDALKDMHTNITEDDKVWIITTLIKHNIPTGKTIFYLIENWSQEETIDIIKDNFKEISTTQAVEKLLLNNNFTEKRSWRFMQNIAADIAKE